MATKPKTATIKKGKRRATKPQPLPKSVKALLGYLSGSDMKLSNNSRAKIAPSQAQNLPQPIINNNYYNQPIPTRVKQAKAVPVGKSPLSYLSQVPPAPPVVIIQQPAPTQAPPPVQQTAPPQRPQLLLGNAAPIRQPTPARATNPIMQFNANPRRQLGFTSPVPVRTRPIIQQQQLGSNISSALPQNAALWTLPKAKVVESRVSPIPNYNIDENAGELGAHLASNYVRKVTSPEMQPIVRLRGRPPMTPAARALGAEASKVKRAETLKVTREEKIKQRTAALQEQTQQQALQAIATKASQQPPEAKTKRILIRPKAATSQLLDSATNIQIMAAGGGAANAPSASKGKKLTDLYDA